MLPITLQCTRQPPFPQQRVILPQISAVQWVRNPGIGTAALVMKSLVDNLEAATKIPHILRQAV